MGDDPRYHGLWTSRFKDCVNFNDLIKIRDTELREGHVSDIMEVLSIGQGVSWRHQNRQRLA